MRFRFISWNLNCSNPARLARQISYLTDLEPDVIALQEVNTSGCEVLEAGGQPWRRVFTSRSLRPPLPSETTSRERFCAILTTDRFAPVGGVELLEDAAAPERSLMVRLNSDDGPLTVASFHQVAGADKEKWGPGAKARTFRAMAAWLSRCERSTVAGMDVNAPKVDHPDVAKNVYHGRPGASDREEYLLHDPQRAPHKLVDTFRSHLAANASELAAIREARPSGPLAITHRVQGAARRYDFVYATPDVRPTEVRYDESVLEHGGSSRLSDHAPLIADLEVGGGS